MVLLSILSIPAIVGPVCFLARRRAAMEALNLVGFAATFLFAVALAAQVLRRGPVSSWGGFLYADHLSALVILLTAGAALASATYAIGYLREDERSGAFDEDARAKAPSSKLRNYYTLTPLFVSAMLLMAMANNLGVMWAAIEATTLASVFLVTFYGRITSLEAGWKYVIIGGVGLSMALFGTILTYYSGQHVIGSDGVGGLNWSVLAERAGQLDKPAMQLAFILILLGYGTKAGLAPMHTWKPDAYSEAPVPAAAILSSATVNCALYGLARFYILASRSLGPEYPGRLLVLFGLASMAIAVPFVLVQRSFRRLLAYSSIDHAGIMAMALGIGGPLASVGLMLHMMFHTVGKSLLFLCAGNVYQHFKTDLFHKMRGSVIAAMPLTGIVFLMAMLAITGMPPFGLFQSEFVILRAAIGGGHVAAAVLLVICVTGVFTGALVQSSRLVLGPGDGNIAAPRPWRNGTLLALAAVLIVLGFWIPAPLFELIRGAAKVVAG